MSLEGATLSGMPESRESSPVEPSSPLGASQRHHPRRFEDFTYAYAVVSRRSGGVSIGVNVNLDKICNFDCPYCQVDRRTPGPKQRIDVAVIQQEVSALLETCRPDGICQLPRFSGIAPQQRRLQDVALSGDGEPTLIPQFAEVCAGLLEEQKQHHDLPFRLVLITNATMLDRPSVQKGVDLLLQRSGAVWAKLDAGTETYYQTINRSRVTLDKVESNLIDLGKKHPMTIQSFFAKVHGERPPASEIAAYLQRLGRIRDQGARIDLVQLYSLARPPAESLCAPLESSYLQGIAERIHALGLQAKVFATAD
jgi:wyosine [tRNA(Phe)-imidazoG37] synthetase (radical SAM superfamily)